MRVSLHPMRFLSAVLLMGALAACRPAPVYAPPPQKILPEGSPPPMVRRLVQMHEPDADAFIVQGVPPGSGVQFRWTDGHPVFRLWPDDLSDQALFLRIGVVHPVTIAIRINGHEIAKPAFHDKRTYDVVQPVPAGVLAAAKPVTIDLEISPVATEPNTGRPLGVTIAAAGFVKAP